MGKYYAMGSIMPGSNPLSLSVLPGVAAAQRPLPGIHDADALSVYDVRGQSKSTPPNGWDSGPFSALSAPPFLNRFQAGTISGG